MGKVVKFPRRKAKARAKKVKARASRMCEYLTITHAEIKAYHPCEWRLVLKTFPYGEFGKRGIPLTPANARRMFKARLPASWIVYRFAPGGYAEYTERFCPPAEQVAFFLRVLREQKPYSVWGPSPRAPWGPRGPQRPGKLHRYKAPAGLNSLVGVKVERLPPVSTPWQHTPPVSTPWQHTPPVQLAI